MIKIQWEALAEEVIRIRASSLIPQHAGKQLPSEEKRKRSICLLIFCFIEITVQEPTAQFKHRLQTSVYFRPEVGTDVHDEACWVMQSQQFPNRVLATGNPRFCIVQHSMDPVFV